MSESKKGGKFRKRGRDSAPNAIARDWESTVWRGQKPMGKKFRKGVGGLPVTMKNYNRGQSIPPQPWRGHLSPNNPRALFRSKGVKKSKTWGSFRKQLSKPLNYGAYYKDKYAIREVPKPLPSDFMPGVNASSYYWGDMYTPGRGYQPENDPNKMMGDLVMGITPRVGPVSHFDVTGRDFGPPRGPPPGIQLPGNPPPPQPPYPGPGRPGFNPGPGFGPGPGPGFNPGPGPDDGRPRFVPEEDALEPSAVNVGPDPDDPWGYQSKAVIPALQPSAIATDIPHQQQWHDWANKWYMREMNSIRQWALNEDDAAENAQLALDKYNALRNAIDRGVMDTTPPPRSVGQLSRQLSGSDAIETIDKLSLMAPTNSDKVLSLDRYDPGTGKLASTQQYSYPGQAFQIPALTPEQQRQLEDSALFDSGASPVDFSSTASPGDFMRSVGRSAVRPLSWLVDTASSGWNSLVDWEVSRQARNYQEQQRRAALRASNAELEAKNEQQRIRDMYGEIEQRSAVREMGLKFQLRQAIQEERSAEVIAQLRNELFAVREELRRERKELEAKHDVVLAPAPVRRPRARAPAEMSQQVLFENLSDASAVQRSPALQNAVVPRARSQGHSRRDRQLEELKRESKGVQESKSPSGSVSGRHLGESGEGFKGGQDLSKLLVTPGYSTDVRDKPVTGSDHYILYMGSDLDRRSTQNAGYGGPGFTAAPLPNNAPTFADRVIPGVTPQMFNLKTGDFTPMNPRR